MPRPKGSKNKPKVATPTVPTKVIKESKKISKAASEDVSRKVEKAPKKSKVIKVDNSVVPTLESTTAPPLESKEDYTALIKLVKAVYDTMPQDQQLRWQQPSEDPSLLTPEDKITVVLVTYFGLDKSKIKALNK
jgi:hypothetical protein